MRPLPGFRQGEAGRAARVLLFFWCFGFALA